MSRLRSYINQIIHTISHHFVSVILVICLKAGSTSIMPRRRSLSRERSRASPLCTKPIYLDAPRNNRHRVLSTSSKDGVQMGAAPRALSSLVCRREQVA